MPQTLPASLVAPARTGLTVGYRLLTTTLTQHQAFTVAGVSEPVPGNYVVSGGISAPDNGGYIQWGVSSGGVLGEILAVASISPAPNQADQAAGIRAAIGLASANLDGQLSGISSKTTNLPTSFPAVDGSGRVTVGTNADKTDYNLGSSQAFNLTGNITGNLSGSVGSVTGAVGSVTGSVGSVTNPVTAGTVSDKTGYSLTSSQTFSTTGAVGSVTGAVGSVTGSVGSVTGAVTVGTIGNNVITANSINAGAITNTKFAAGAIDAAAIATDAIDADAIAASAVTEIQAGLASQASVDTKASQASVNAIPTTPPDNTGIAAIKAKTDNLPSDPADQSELVTLINTRLAAANYTAPDNTGIAAIKAKTDNLPSDPADQSELAALITAIPTTPLLAANYTAPDNASISAIKAKTDNLPSDPADQSELVTLINTRLAAANYTTPPTTAQIATAVEAALLNDADGQALLAAIQAAVQALFDQQADIPVSTLVSLIAAQITADHGSGSYTTANLSAVALEATAQAIKVKTDNLPSDPADQSELVALINTRLAAANYTAPDNASISAIKAKTDNLPSDPADQSELVTLINTRLAAANYTAPDNTGIAAIKAKTDNLPSDPADQSELVTLINAKASQASVDALPSAATIADAVWDEALSGHTNTGTTGKKLADTSTLTVGDIPPGLSAADVWTHPTRALTDKDNFGLADNAIDADTLATSAVTKIQNGLATAASISTPAQIASQVRTELTTELARINVDLSTRLAAANYTAPDNAGILSAIAALPGASIIADAVWDEALSGHLTAGSTGAKLNLASTLTVGDIPAGLSAQQVWEYATRTLTTASGLTTEQNTRLNELWRKAGLDLATPVVRTLNPATGNVTEALGATTITHTESNSGNTVTTARQP